MSSPGYPPPGNNPSGYNNPGHPPGYTAPPPYPDAAYNTPQPKKRSPVLSVLVSVICLLAAIGGIYSRYSAHKKNKIVDVYNADIAFYNPYLDDVGKALEPVSSLPDNAAEDTPDFVRLYNKALGDLSSRTDRLISDEKTLDLSGCADDFKSAYSAYADQLRAAQGALHKRPTVNPSFLAAVSEGDKPAVQQWVHDSSEALKEFNATIPHISEARLHMRDVVKAHGIELEESPAK